MAEIKYPEDAYIPDHIKAALDKLVKSWHYGAYSKGKYKIITIDGEELDRQLAVTKPPANTFWVHGTTGALQPQHIVSMRDCSGKLIFENTEAIPAAMMAALRRQS